MCTPARVTQVLTPDVLTVPAREAAQLVQAAARFLAVRRREVVAAPDLLQVAA